MALRGEEVCAGIEAGGLYRTGDIEDVVALWNHDRDGVDVAAMHAVVDLKRRRGMVEPVFAGLKGSTARKPQRLELVAGAQDPRLLQLFSDGQRARSWRYVDELFRGRAVRYEEQKRQRRSGDHNQKQQKLEYTHWEPRTQPKLLFSLIRTLLSWHSPCTAVPL